MATAAGRAGLSGAYLAAAILFHSMPAGAQQPLAAHLVPVSTGMCISRQLASLDIGFTWTHEIVNTEVEDSCATQGKAQSLDGANNIVKHYDDPALRQRVQSMLTKMAADGATVVRTIVWFRHAEDAPMAKRTTDPLGLLVATDGKLPAGEVNNIVSYVSDAQAAGYSRFVVVVGPQGTSNPKCRKGTEWGGCYDETLLARSWSVVDQVATALHTPQLSKIDVVVDLSSENCADPNSKMQNLRFLYGNVNAFTRYMVSHYRDKFGDHQFIASCGTGSQERVLGELAAQVSLFRDLGVRPASLDIHMYETDPEVLRNILLSADATARRLGVPLDVLETYYDHASLFKIVSDLMSANQLPSLRDLVVWPRKMTSECSMDVRAPYDMKGMDAELGRRNSDGQSLQVCR